jgi:FtsP/CotA-like multicopper oxidase with cupredoxin domain
MKRFLIWIAVLGAAAVLGLIGVGAALYLGEGKSNVGELDFATELAVPPLLEGREQDGRKVFDLNLEHGTTELLPGKPAETWGVNGSYLGPTLRAARGDDVVVRVHNELPEATNLHWHGMHLPAQADGGPHQPIAPGATWEPSWRIDQPAASLWYHPHPHGVTADHVYRGLAGMFIVDDPQADALPLPDRYGVNDIPLIIEDKLLNDDGSIDFDQSMFGAGRLGDTILVNGTHDPHLAIGDQRVRFRLLNASNARIYNIGFLDDRAFDLIATDAGLLEQPRPLQRLQLSPGERAEIVATFEPGETVVLRSFEPELGTESLRGRFSGGDDTFDLLQIRAAAALHPAPALPDRLTTLEPLPPVDPTSARHIEFTGGDQINGQSMDMNRVDQAVIAGSTEMWELRNNTADPHNFHIHGVSFRVVEQAGEPPPPQRGGWKDTVYLPPGQTVRFIAQFPDYPDPATPYMFHCHILQHEDRGMMGQFVLVEPGQQPHLADHAGH